jgi:phosphate transport system permease protein
VILPIALPNIISGLLLSIRRVSGETAPLFFTVAIYSIHKLPTSAIGQVMALPYQLYELSMSETNIVKQKETTYGIALILILIVLILNIITYTLKRYLSKSYKSNN